jgi:hypothetical protein
MSAAPAAAMFKEDQKEKKNRWNACLSPFLNALYRNGGY